MFGQEVPPEVLPRSPGESSSSISDNAIRKLTESLQQQAASLLTSIKVPEFRGTVEEVFEEWYADFKQTTLTFNDGLRCLALQKALFGAARIWAKNSSLPNDDHLLTQPTTCCKRAVLAPTDADARQLHVKDHTDIRATDSAASKAREFTQSATTNRCRRARRLIRRPNRYSS